METYSEMTESDLSELRQAKSRLEYPGLTAKLTALIGKPIEAGLKLLPKDWNSKLAEITQAALLKGLEFAVRTMGRRSASQDWFHKALVTTSGIAGGAFGLASLTIELPISTTIILRSIADIARSEGHDLSLLETRLACLEVLALGGKSTKDDAAAEGYWAVRAVLAREITEAAAYIARKGVERGSAPVLARFIAAIESRFSMVVTEEIAAKAVPIVGAAAGGAINYLFMDHFQEMARGHFVIRRLESKYGTELVERIYRELVI